jgi:SAM-dependent methyltransferase
VAGGAATGFNGAVTPFDGPTYQARFDALAEEGVDVHGEAALVRSFDPATVLDAGCGTGRVAIELARHGIEVVGVDVDPSMVAEARRRAPQLTWLRTDLSTLSLGRTFEVVVLAGNVPLFCPPDSRPSLVTACAGHVAPDGYLVSGFQLDGRYRLEDYDAGCAASGLQAVARWSAWDRRPFGPTDAYAVSVHRRIGAAASAEGVP